VSDDSGNDEGICGEIGEKDYCSNYSHRIGVAFCFERFVTKGASPNSPHLSFD
jgi:hypothetical protein